jgi:DNA-binding PadR family transcriptional regulator
MRYRQADDERPAPLSPQVFQILVSLLDGPRHGYAIIQDIRERTSDELTLTASTLYDALARLVDHEWIEETDGSPDEAPGGGARRYYRLTPLGQKVARSEAERLERLLGTVRGTRLLRGKRS